MIISNYKHVISLLLLTGILSSLSCSNENNETQTGENNVAPLQSTPLASTMVAENIQAVSAETLTHGEEAHKNHCYKCHTDDVYTRDNRFVKSIDALSKQVVRCKDNTEAAWFDEDSEAVVQFLNQKYYKF